MKTYVALCGGVGGSKLAEGLAQILSPNELTIVVNTADDFDHLGLRICPDIDTVTYMLAGLAHPQRGWGRVDETWACMETMTALGDDAWFQLGDRDLALHLHRTQRLKNGASLATVTAEVCQRLNVRHVPVPMCEEPVSTSVSSEIGKLSFQDYFVRHRCEVKAHAIDYDGIDLAKPSEAFERALRTGSLAGVIIAPSNPLLSIEPILRVPSLRQLLVDRSVPVIAVSPLIGGKAVKGPADKLMAELGHPPGNAGVAKFYGGLLDRLIVDSADAADHANEIPVFPGDILMKDAAGRRRVAQLCIDCLSDADEVL